MKSRSAPAGVQRRASRANVGRERRADTRPPAPAPDRRTVRSELGQEQQPDVAAAESDRHAQHRGIGAPDGGRHRGDLRVGQIGIRDWNGEVVLRELLRRKEDDAAAGGVEPEREQRMRQFDAERVRQRGVPGREHHRIPRRLIGADQRNQRQLAIRLVHRLATKHVVCLAGAIRENAVATCSVRY